VFSCVCVCVCVCASVRVFPEACVRVSVKKTTSQNVWLRINSN